MDRFAAGTERRLANFVAQAPLAPGVVPPPTGTTVEDHFNAHVAQIEENPAAYAAYQKLMVRRAIAEDPAPTFCQVVTAAWPQ